MCIFCWSKSASLLCDPCRRDVRALPATRVSGVRIESAATHEGVARRLVHLLKYQAMEAAGLTLAALMAPLVPGDAEALVPVPRAGLRRLRYGVDPARVLASVLGDMTGIQVVAGIAAVPWWPSHAGSERTQRRTPGFRMVRPIPAGGVLVDDVVTTGTTLVAAAELAGCRQAVTATRAERHRLE